MATGSIKMATADKNIQTTEKLQRNRDLQLIPAVQAHLDKKVDQLRKTLVFHDDLTLAFTGVRGASIMRATLQSHNFDKFSPDDRQLGGKCFFFTQKFCVWTFDDVDIMCQQMHDGILPDKKVRTRVSVEIFLEARQYN